MPLTMGGSCVSFLSSGRYAGCEHPASRGSIPVIPHSSLAELHALARDREGFVIEHRRASRISPGRSSKPTKQG